MTPLRRTRAVAAVLLLCAVLTSCTTVTGIVRTQRALNDAGYRDSSINFRADKAQAVLRIGYRTKAPDVAKLADEYADVARIAWQKAPLPFDVVEVSASDPPGSCVGDCVYRFERATLRAMYGARDPSLDKNIQKEALNVLWIVLAVVGFAVILTITLLIRWRRKSGKVPPGQWQQGSPLGQWQQGSPPPAWGAPPPVAPTPHQPSPGFGPPPPGYVAPQAAPAPSAAPSAAPVPPAAAGAPPAWPPSEPAPSYDPPPPPPPMPQHDIWARPPS